MPAVAALMPVPLAAAARVRVLLRRRAARVRALEVGAVVDRAAQLLEALYAHSATARTHQDGENK